MKQDEKNVFDNWYLEFEKAQASPILIVGRGKGGEVIVMSTTLFSNSTGKEIDTIDFILELGIEMKAQKVPYTKMENKEIPRD